MPPRPRAPSTVLAAALLLGVCTQAHGNGLGGTFSGRAFGSHVETGGPLPGSVDGERVEGTFSFQVPNDAVPLVSGLGQVLYAADVRLSFSVGGRTVRFPQATASPAGGVVIDPVGLGYVVVLGPSYENDGRLASLSLAGTAADPLLADLFDPSSFRAGTVDFSRTGAGFFATGFDAQVVVDRVQFDGVAPQAVPEPETWALLLGGLALAGGLRRRAG